MSTDKLDLILEKIEKIEKRLDKLEESCIAMDKHIGFVDQVYKTVRTPLDFILHRINYLTGTKESLYLPEKIQLKEELYLK